MQGYLKKRVQEFKFWQKKLYYKRFMKIDFPNGLIYFSHLPNPTPNDKSFKKIPFGQVKEASTFTDQVEVNLIA